MSRHSLVGALPAFTLLIGLLLASSPAWSVRPQCDGRTPPASGVCFIEEPFLGVVFEAPLTEPTEMVLLLVEDPTDEFVRIFPDGRLFVHTPEREGDMIWCPFPFAEFDFANPQPECVFGTARLQANGYIELNGDFGCPYTARLRGSGIRGSDNAAFEVSSDLLLNPSRRNLGDCEIIKNDITASPVE